MVAAMKVLHIVKTAVGANWAYEQVRVLCSLGIEVVVALPSDTEGLAPKYREAGATVLRANLDFPAREPWRIPATLRSCRQLVADVRPDLIHTHHVGTTFIARLALGKNSPIPRVFQVPGPLHLEHRFFAWLDVALAGPRDFWIATCRWTYQKYLDLGINSGRVFFSYTGTNTEPFRGVRTGLLRKELGISPEVPLVGMVAYMYAPKRFLGQRRGLKGHEDFIAALCQVRETNPNVRAVIIGGPWGRALRYETRLRKLGAKVGNGWLTFLRTRRDIPAIYPDLDLAVVPSHSENCGGAVEPLLSGVPVVATNVGGLPDLVQENKTGWLVPPRSPKELARAILDSLQNPNESRRRAIEGQKLAQTTFEVKSTGREVASVYEKILAPQTNPSLVDSIESRDPLGSKPPETSEIAARATGQW
jgi:glycosyltransferase involved in cell wall biosynthesis